MRRAPELKGLARSATDRGKATSSPLATATDDEIERLAGRIVGRSRRVLKENPTQRSKGLCHAFGNTDALSAS